MEKTPKEKEGNYENPELNVIGIGACECETTENVPESFP